MSRHWYTYNSSGTTVHNICTRNFLQRVSDGRTRTGHGKPIVLRKIFSYYHPALCIDGAIFIFLVSIFLDTYLYLFLVDFHWDSALRRRRLETEYIRSYHFLQLVSPPEKLPDAFGFAVHQ